MADTPGTLRPIPDPQAEMERLAEARKRATVFYVLGEEHDVTAGGHAVRVVINVAASEHRPLPPGFGARIAAMIQQAWEAGE